MASLNASLAHKDPNPQIRFQDYVLLLHKESRNAFGRLCNRAPHIYYEDVFQQSCIAFTKAKNQFKPELGFAFTTFLMQKVRFGFQDWIRRLGPQIEERVKHGVRSMCELEVQSDEGVDLQLLDTIPSDDLSPEDYCARKQLIEQKLRTLSSDARRVLNEYLYPSEQLMERFRQERRTGDCRFISLALVYRYLGLSSKQKLQVRQELAFFREIED